MCLINSVPLAKILIHPCTFLMFIDLLMCIVMFVGMYFGNSNRVTLTLTLTSYTSGWWGNRAESISSVWVVLLVMNFNCLTLFLGGLEILSTSLAWSRLCKRQQEHYQTLTNLSSHLLYSEMHGSHDPCLLAQGSNEYQQKLPRFWSEVKLNAV